MNRALFSGVSGLRAFQTWMDVVANNVANINTSGFKTSRAEFGDVLSQTLRAATNPDSGGMSEATQIGLGTRIVGMTTNFTQGALLSTARVGDVAIQGDGFFITQSGGQTLYTRAGAFRFDANGNLTDPTGGLVQGWTADAQGNISTGAALGNITVNPNTSINAIATTTMTLGGSLPAGDAIGDIERTESTVYDSLGTAHQLQFEYTKTANNTWDLRVYDTGVADPLTTSGYAEILPITGPSPVTFTFDAATGDLTDPHPADYPVVGTPSTLPSYTFTPTTGAAAQDIELSFGTPGVGSPLQQFDGEMSAAVIDRNGSIAGSLRALAIADSGDVVATFSNGEIRTVGRVATATFANPGGLEKVGDTQWRATPGSGFAMTGTPGTGGRGALSPGTLEGSNVDLAMEFTNLVIAQRGFQANTRVVSTSDQMLEELVNIKR